jgi:hypothetical protein
VTFEVKPIEQNSAPALETNPSRWSGTVSETANPDGTRTFTANAPLNITEAEAAQAADERVEATNATVQSAKITAGNVAATADLTAAASGAFMKIVGTTANPDAVTITEISYRIGIRRYTQKVDVKLSDVLLEPNDDEPDDSADPDDNGGGGGCDAGTGMLGLGLFALAASSLAAKQNRKNGKK